MESLERFLEEVLDVPGSLSSYLTSLQSATRNRLYPAISTFLPSLAAENKLSSSQSFKLQKKKKNDDLQQKKGGNGGYTKDLVVVDDEHGHQFVGPGAIFDREADNVFHLLGFGLEDVGGEYDGEVVRVHLVHGGHLVHGLEELEEDGEDLEVGDGEELEHLLQLGHYDLLLLESGGTDEHVVKVLREEWVGILPQPQLQQPCHHVRVLILCEHYALALVEPVSVLMYGRQAAAQPEDPLMFESCIFIFFYFLFCQRFFATNFAS